jgi:hypothetical protein
MTELSSTIDCIENYLQSQTGSKFKNMNASYLIVSILMNSDFQHYGPETLLQDAFNEYQKVLVESNN